MTEFSRVWAYNPKILHAHESWETALINALDWLLAEGTITVDGSERRVSELLLEGGPLFSAPERQYLERLAAAPLKLYEVAEVTPGRSMSLKDVLLPERLPVLVRENTGSKKVLQFDLIATRIVSMEDHFVLSGSVYLIPRRHGLELIGKLRKHLDDLAMDSPEAKKVLRDHFELLAQTITSLHHQSLHPGRWSETVDQRRESRLWLSLHVAFRTFVGI